MRYRALLLFFKVGKADRTTLARQETYLPSDARTANSFATASLCSRGKLLRTAAFRCHQALSIAQRALQSYVREILHHMCTLYICTSPHRAYHEYWSSRGVIVFCVMQERVRRASMRLLPVRSVRRTEPVACCIAAN